MTSADKIEEGIKKIRAGLDDKLHKTVEQDPLTNIFRTNMEHIIDDMVWLGIAATIYNSIPHKYK